MSIEVLFETRNQNRNLTITDRHSHIVFTRRVKASHIPPQKEEGELYCLFRPINGTFDFQGVGNGDAYYYFFGIKEFIPKSYYGLNIFNKRGDLIYSTDYIPYHPFIVFAKSMTEIGAHEAIFGEKDGSTMSYITPGDDDEAYGHRHWNWYNEWRTWLECREVKYKMREHVGQTEGDNDRAGDYDFHVNVVDTKAIDDMLDRR